MSETDGFIENIERKKTKCQIAKEQLKSLITDDTEAYEKLLLEIDNAEDEISREYSDVSDISEDECEEILPQKKRKKILTKWEEWASSKKKDIQSKVKSEIGTHDNAHFDIKIADKLVEEVRHIPMWSNIFNNKFDFSHIRPSSSASVECEIKKIKNNVLEKKGKTTRIDKTVEKIINYYDGRLRNLKVENNEGSASETISDLENSENSIYLLTYTY